MKSSANEQQLSIGEMADRFGMETHVLRHWEDVGLLAPARDAAGRRRYGSDDLVRIAVIVRSKAAGMSLDQIGAMLDSDAADRHRVLEDHIRDLDRRLAEMARSRMMTEHALACRAHDIAACPRFREHVQDVLTGVTKRFGSSGLPVSSA